MTPRLTAAGTASAGITAIRFHDPARITEALAARRPFPGIGRAERLLLVAADHPARGALAAGDDGSAMADRHQLIDRAVEALSRPGVHGFVGTADLVEELALIGALEGKLVLGSMNRGGLVGSAFELDDRFTGYDARGIVAAGLDGGKMLLRIDPRDPATAGTLTSCARAVDDLTSHDRIALVEPIWCDRIDGRLRADTSPEAVMRSMTVASGLGRTSVRTWLKVPATTDTERVVAATTLPTLLMGGDASPDQDAVFSVWRDVLRLPGVRGLVAGRALLYPPDGDVTAAVDTAVRLLDAGAPPTADVASAEALPPQSPPHHRGTTA